MLKPEISEDESLRLAALKGYSILDTLPEKEFDEITFIASQICQTPISLISLIDDKRQWFKSHQGLDATETPREIAFCAHAINDKDNILIVPDSRNDVRFFDNPLVTGDPHVVFYAGMPLVNSEGFSLGTLCVIDNKPRNLNEFQIQALKILRNQIIKLFELRKKSLELELKVHELEIQNKGLEKFASVAAHDIKSPLASITMLTNLLQTNYLKDLDSDGQELVEFIKISSQKLTQLIDGILKYSRNVVLLSKIKEEVNIQKVINDLIIILATTSDIQITISPEKEIILYTNKIALEQILLNLIANSIKYNDKEKTIIAIILEDKGDIINFKVIDNGPGIKHENLERIFQIFETVSNTDKFGEKGNGIGLATVKSLLEGLGGTIKVSSEIGISTTFEFTIRK